MTRVFCDDRRAVMGCNGLSDKGVYDDRRAVTGCNGLSNEGVCDDRRAVMGCCSTTRRVTHAVTATTSSVTAGTLSVVGHSSIPPSATTNAAEPGNVFILLLLKGVTN